LSETLTPAIRQAVVLDVVGLAREKYVYPDVGEKLARSIQARLEEGSYDEITDAGELALMLTEDLRALSNDRHWSVVYQPRQAPANAVPVAEEEKTRWAQWLAQARRRNFGFERVERLGGNVGYIDLREFVRCEVAGETAVAAMGLVAHCDALVFDLGQNRGGNPSMVQLLTSYLFDPEPRHINTFYRRPTDDYQQFWTFPYVPGKRLPHIPVYVLTSHATGSAAEEFAYNLKHMARATVVGESTVGAAHPAMVEMVQECFQVRLPYGRPINPITKGNWEGAGVEPHITVPQEDALKTAHLHAMETMIANFRDDSHKRTLEWEMEIVESQYMPTTVEETSLSRYVGQYGKRSFAVEDGTLTYTHREHAAVWRLVPITTSRFRLDDDLKFEFIVDEQGLASAVTIFYRDGRPEITVSRTK
jgi:RimJ/RimL family protein N-acetyltransferase